MEFQGNRDKNIVTNYKSYTNILQLNRRIALNEQDTWRRIELGLGYCNHIVTI